MTRARVLVVIAAIAGARLAIAAPFHAEPAVRVITVAANGSGSGAVVLKNDGATPVVATSIVAAPGCDASAVHAAPLAGFMLAPGAMRTLNLSCTPAPPSMQRCTYQVRAAGDAVLLELEAVCAYGNDPSLAAPPAPLDFGAVNVGAAASISVPLVNLGAATFDRLFFEITDPAGNFAIARPCNPDARACDAAVVPAPNSASTEIAVTCTPRSAGPQTADLYITTSAGTRLAAPIALACTGVAATTPVLSVSPTVIDLGAVEQVDATATTTLHLSNAGTGPLVLLDLQIVDSDSGAAPDWSYAAQLPCAPTIPGACTLDTGGAVDLAVSFDPSALGVRDATLIVHYHDTADRSTAIPLRGTGHGPTLELLGGAAKLNFGTLPLDTPGELAIQVVNRGTRALTGATATLMPPVAGLTVTPGSMITVSPTAPTTITVGCELAAAGIASSTLRIEAADVLSPPIDLAVTCTADPAQLLFATPPALLLGELRVDAQAMAPFELDSVGGPIDLGGARFTTPDPALSLGPLPAMTPATLDLLAKPTLEGPLDNLLEVTPTTGPALAIPISGTAVIAKYAVPSAISLGTFCVEQPTAARSIALSSTGSATLGISTPALKRADSPFDLTLVAPLAFPAELVPTARAVVTITPKRQTIGQTVMDTLVWTTDADEAIAQTTLTATFVDAGPAVSPTLLAFPPTPIHLDSGTAQQVTLRNCSVSPLELDPPQIPAPFTIDSPSFPSVLAPGETVTASVGFHPTRVEHFMRELVITSPQLRDVTFVVTLIGDGTADGSGSGSGSGSGNVTTGVDSKSFYACGSCATGGTSSALALTLAALVLLVPRRRRTSPTTR